MPTVGEWMTSAGALFRNKTAQESIGELPATRHRQGADLDRPGT
jgi:hypothetical protein